jgi:PAS domain S-box-containing protein
VTHATKLKAVAAAEREVLGMSFASNEHPMWIFDRGTHDFLDVNDAALRMYGYSRQEFLSMSIFDTRSEDQPRFRKKLDRRLQAPRTAERYVHQAKTGNVFPVSITSWQLTFKGCEAELVLARREGCAENVIFPSKCTGYQHFVQAENSNHLSLAS